MTMRLLFQTPDCDRTVLLGDPSDRISELVVAIVGEQLEGAAVRVVSSPERPPWKGAPPPWVRDSWYRAVWRGLPQSDRRRLALVASREATRIQPLDPERCRSVVALWDPQRTFGFGPPAAQWRATGDLLAGVNGPEPTDDAIAAADRVAELITLVAADEPQALVTVLAAELGIGPKRTARMVKALRSRWPTFGPSRSTPHWLDIELYARAVARPAHPTS